MAIAEGELDSVFLTLCFFRCKIDAVDHHYNASPDGWNERDHET
jgi:hypothetical protein